MPSGCQPFLTRRFELALQFASGLHHAQCRKGTPVPYISHLMAVVKTISRDKTATIGKILAPGMYFRLMLIGFFEGIESERGIDPDHHIPP